MANVVKHLTRSRGVNDPEDNTFNTIVIDVAEEFQTLHAIVDLTCCPHCQVDSTALPRCFGGVSPNDRETP